MVTSRAVLFRRFGWYCIYILLGLVVSVGVYKLLVSFFSLDTIEVVGTNIQISVDNNRLPKTLLFFPADKIRQELLRENPILSDIEFKKQYPHTLLIVPKLRAPFITLHAKDRTVWVDATGIVVGDADGTGSYPNVYIPVVGIRIGQIIADTRVTTSIGLIAGLQDILTIGEIAQQEDGSLRATGDKASILFTQDSSTDRILTTLQTLLSGFRIKGTLPTLIDLRFDKPIVTF